MNILCFASATKMLEKISKAVIAVGDNEVAIELYKSIDEVYRRIYQPRASNCILILCPKNKKEIHEIISMLDALSGMKIILVLPKRDKDSIKSAYRIFPRFMAFADEDFTSITLVLKKNERLLCRGQGAGLDQGALILKKMTGELVMTEQQGRQTREEDFFDDDDEDTQKGKYLTFTVGKEDYGIEIYNVTEIIGIQKITDVPDMPAYIKGVINLRGKVISVMDVRLRFKMTEREYDDRTCIVVVSVGGAAVGLVVDTVKEVANIPESQIELPPEVAEASSQSYVKGLGMIGDDVKILLDVAKLVRREALCKMPLTGLSQPACLA